MAQDGGKVVSLRHQPLLPPGKYSWYSFLFEAGSIPGPFAIGFESQSGHASIRRGVIFEII